MFELDIDQPSTRAKALQLQIAIAANNVAQIAPQDRFPLHGSHRDGLLAKDNGRPIASDHDMAADISPHCRTSRTSGVPAGRRYGSRTTLGNTFPVPELLPQRRKLSFQSGNMLA
jgi:hypothetical protein